MQKKTQLKRTYYINKLRVAWCRSLVIFVTNTIYTIIFFIDNIA